MTPKNYVVCRNTAKVGKLKVHVLQLLNVQKSQHNATPTRHETMSRDKSVDLTGVYHVARHCLNVCDIIFPVCDKFN